MKITNTAAGPRGVETETGTVFVEPGQTVDVEVVKGHELYEGLVEGEKTLDKLSKAELTAIADAEGVLIETDDNKADLVRKIEESRAA